MSCLSIERAWFVVVLLLLPAHGPEALGAQGHVVFSELVACSQLVVNAAPQPKVLDGALPSARNRQDVIEFEKCSSVAAVPAGADVRAATSVALVDNAGDLRRDWAALRLLLLRSRT